MYLQTQRYSLVPMLIRAVTRSPWSHVGFYKDGKFLSAQGDGVKQRGHDKYSALLLATAPGIDEAYEWALTQIGKPYDYWALAGLTLNRNWRDASAWYCAELVRAAFEHSPSVLFNPIFPANRPYPNELLIPPHVSVLTIDQLAEYNIPEDIKHYCVNRNVGTYSVCRLKNK